MEESFPDLFFKSEISDQYAAAILRQELAKAPADVESLQVLKLCLEDPIPKEESTSLHGLPFATKPGIFEDCKLDELVNSAAKDFPFLQRSQSYSREELNTYISRQMANVLQPKAQPQPQHVKSSVARIATQAPAQVYTSNPNQAIPHVVFQQNLGNEPLVQKPKASLQSLVGNRTNRGNPEHAVHVLRPQPPQPAHAASTFYQRNPARKRVYEREASVEAQSETEESASAFVSARSKLKKTQHKQGWNRSNSCNSGDSDSYSHKQNHGGRGNRKRHRSRFKPPARLNEPSNTTNNHPSNRRRAANNSSNQGGKFRVDIG